MLREVELATGRASLITFRPTGKGPTATWALPASKADSQALGAERTHGGAWQAKCGFALCPVHVLWRHRCALRRWNPELHSSEEQPHTSLLLFPAESGEPATKAGMGATTEHFAVQLGCPRRSPEGHTHWSGHSMLVGGAQSLASEGLDTWENQLLGRW